MQSTEELIKQAEAEDAESKPAPTPGEPGAEAQKTTGEEGGAPPPSVAARGLVAGMERIFKFKDRRLAWSDDERKEGEEVLQPVIEKRGLTGPLSWLPEFTAIFWIIAALASKMAELRKLRTTDEESERRATESAHPVPGAERRGEIPGAQAKH